MGVVRILHWGTGEMGAGMVRLVQEIPGLRSVGAVVRPGPKEGRDLGELAGLGRELGIRAVADPAAAVAGQKADIALHATGSFTGQIYQQLKALVELGLDVITVAEEMAFPWHHEPELAAELDGLARERGVSVLGTGINPGFVLDTLIVALTGACWEVRRIRAARINDLSPFGPAVMKTQGVGTTPDEFRRGLADGTIVGHVGFPESMQLIATAIGWKLESIREEREPIISRTRRQTRHVLIEPGMVAGCRHTARGFVGGEVVIELEHPQQVLPELEGVETGDYIWIDGVPPLNFANKPEIPGGTGTIAVAVNAIPLVREARPGLLTMIDLPLPRALAREKRR
ncbi:MAG: 2,4-diaminopentanoate dehydrogenase [bacterium]|nr:2,4-diaminopentanoate dehydrogenase [bacterium]